MSEPAKTTVLHAPFAGRRRRFCLRLDEMGELETLCGAGIGGIWARTVTLHFKAADIRETIRLGLIGGEEMPPPQAALLVESYVDARPLAENLSLAIDILKAYLEGVEEAAKDMPGKETGEGSEDPATSPPSSAPERPPASRPARSAR